MQRRWGSANLTTSGWKRMHLGGGWRRLKTTTRGRGVFAAMFPDSHLAKSFTCGENKTAYVAKYGIASFIKKELSCSVSEKPYVVMFDESSWVTPELRTCWVISM